MYNTVQYNRKANQEWKKKKWAAKSLTNPKITKL